VSGLKDVSVGDVLVVVDAGGLKPLRCTVTKVGPKYVTVGELRFFRETGAWDSIGFGDQKRAYTKEQWSEHKHKE
jgi:hypothetical protein